MHLALLVGTSGGGLSVLLALLVVGLTYSIASGDYIRPYRNCRVQRFKEAPGGQTFLIGDVLVKDANADKSHKVKVSGADPATNTVVGIALENATGVEDSDILVAVLDERAEFLIAVADTQTLDNDDAGGIEYGIVVDATNKIWRLDLTETTAKVFRVVQLAPGYVHGDVNGKYIVKSAIGRQAVYAA